MLWRRRHLATRWSRVRSRSWVAGSTVRAGRQDGRYADSDDHHAYGYRGDPSSKAVTRAALLVLLLVACGGGGGGITSDGVIAPSRAGLYYGYFGSCSTCYAGFKDHVNLLMEVPDWNGIASTISDMSQAKLPTILYTPQDAPTLTFMLTELRNANVLQYVIAFYPLDEPNGMTDAAVLAVLAVQRQVASQFVELANVKMAVIYAPGGDLPGMSGYDLVGFDDYDAGTGAVGGELDDFERMASSGQRIIVVPGGADPWRTDPNAFYNRAQSDPRVLLIMPFLWADYSGGRGIGSNGEQYIYRPYGLAIKDANAYLNMYNSNGCQPGPSCDVRITFTKPAGT